MLGSASFWSFIAPTRWNEMAVSEPRQIRTPARPTVAVVIPVINEARSLPVCLAALANSDLAAFEGLEVIVVDGGSTDGTQAVAEAAGVPVRESPPGRAAQQNSGAAQTLGDVLLFLHADCRVPPGIGSQLTAALTDEAVVGGSIAHRIDDPRGRYRCLAWGNNVRAWWGRPYGDQGLFVRRCQFDAVGGFPDVPILEDVHFVRRLRQRGRLTQLPGPLLTGARHWTKRGVIRQTLRNWRILAWDALGLPPEEIVRRLTASKTGRG